MISKYTMPNEIDEPTEAIYCQERKPEMMVLREGMKPQERTLDSRNASHFQTF